MATRRVPAPQPPSLKPEQAIPILEGLIRKGEENLGPERYNSPQRKEWAHTGEGALIAALGNEDPAIHAFRSSQCGSYGPSDTDERLWRQANRQLNGMLSVLRSVVEQLRWKLPDPQQVFMPPGSQHDALCPNPVHYSASDDRSARHRSLGRRDFMAVAYKHSGQL